MVSMDIAASSRGRMTFLGGEYQLLDGYFILTSYREEAIYINIFHESRRLKWTEGLACRENVRRDEYDELGEIYLGEGAGKSCPA